MKKYFCRLITPKETLQGWVIATESFNAAVKFVADHRDRLTAGNEYDLGVVGDNNHKMLYCVKQKRNHSAIQPDLFCGKEKFDAFIDDTIQASRSNGSES